MRIKKVSQIAGTVGGIVNSTSTSSNDAYSCSYVNGLNTYSTTEQRIGTWIDGKPIYRKVIPITNPQSSNTNYENVSGLNISSLVHLYGFYKGASGNIFDIPFHDSESNYSVIFLSDAGYIRGRFGNPTTIAEIKVIIEYTKTTD